MVKHHDVESSLNILTQPGTILDFYSEFLLECIVDIDDCFHAISATCIVPMSLESDGHRVPLLYLNFVLLSMGPTYAISLRQL